MRYLQRVFERIIYAILRKSPTNEELIANYLVKGRIPWSDGYSQYRWDYIKKTITDQAILDTFANGLSLPTGFAYRLDERPVEYGWVFSNLSKTQTKIFDAGSTFNFEPIIDIIMNNGKKLTIMTLAPEAKSFWSRGISYQFGDLRSIPFRDNWFDEIVSISTIEHIGFDNSIYSASENTESDKGISATVNELMRVLKPGGQMLITVPFGKKQELYVNGKVFAQQFNAEGVHELLSYVQSGTSEVSYFRYQPDGWQTASVDDCANAVYFNIHESPKFAVDFAAAARAIACIRIEKHL